MGIITRIKGWINMIFKSKVKDDFDEHLRIKPLWIFNNQGIVKVIINADRFPYRHLYFVNRHAYHPHGLTFNF